MIEHVKHLQCMECTACGEQVEIRRKVLRDPEQMLSLLEEMREEHKACEEFEGDPERARIERGYRVRMRCEMRRKQR